MAMADAEPEADDVDADADADASSSVLSSMPATPLHDNGSPFLGEGEASPAWSSMPQSPAYVAPPAVPTGERTVNPALAKALKSADKAKKKDFVYSSKPVEPAICGTRLAEGWTTGKAGIGK